MQQTNAAAATATTLYDNAATVGVGGSMHSNAGPTSDAGDAVMARWLQSAGLQHLASPLASASIDHRLLPNLLMQVPCFNIYDIFLLAFCFVLFCFTLYLFNLGDIGLTLLSWFMSTFSDRVGYIFDIVVLYMLDF